MSGTRLLGLRRFHVWSRYQYLIDSCCLSNTTDNEVSRALPLAAAKLNPEIKDQALSSLRWSGVYDDGS